MQTAQTCLPSVCLNQFFTHATFALTATVWLLVNNRRSTVVARQRLACVHLGKTQDGGAHGSGISLESPDLNIVFSHDLLTVGRPGNNFLITWKLFLTRDNFSRVGRWSRRTDRLKEFVLCSPAMSKF